MAKLAMWIVTSFMINYTQEVIFPFFLVQGLLKKDVWHRHNFIAVVDVETFVSSVMVNPCSFVHTFYSLFSILERIQILILNYCRILFDLSSLKKASFSSVT